MFFSTIKNQELKEMQQFAVVANSKSLISKRVNHFSNSLILEKKDKEGTLIYD